MTIKEVERLTGMIRENIRFYENRFVPKNKTSLLANDVLQTLVMRNGDIYVLTMGGGAQKVLSDNLLSDSLHFEVNVVPSVAQKEHLQHGIDTRN